jgi:hypothetical protein
MIQIGALTLQHSGTYIVRDGIDLFIKIQIEGAWFSLRVRFLDDESRKGQINWRGENGELVVECWSWKEAFGASVPQPIRIVEHQKFAYFIDLAHHLVSDTTHLITVHILTEEVRNGPAK